MLCHPIQRYKFESNSQPQALAHRSSNILSTRVNLKQERTLPSHSPVAGCLGGLCRSHHADAHVRSAVVVEVCRQSRGRDDLFQGMEDLALEQLVLHRVVDALGLRVLLRVS